MKPIVAVLLAGTAIFAVTCYQASESWLELIQDGAQRMHALATSRRTNDSRAALPAYSDLELDMT